MSPRGRPTGEHRSAFHEGLPDSTRQCLVLLPGTLCDGRLFAPLVPALRADCRVIVLDYRRLADIDAWPANVLQRLPARFSLAGFSLGGLWALELARRAPERVERLALIASNAEGGSRVGRNRSADLWRLWRRRGPGEVARRLKPRYFHHESLRRRHAGLVRAMALATSAKAARAEFAWAARRPQALDVLAASRRPTLFVSGSHDPLCPRRLQQRMVQAQPGASWVELPRCGHFVPLERRAALASLLSRWLRSPSPLLASGVPA